MDFETFKTDFISQLKLKSQDCLELIEKNKELIQENLGNDANPETIKNFVNEINDVVVENENLINIIIDGKKKLNVFSNKYELLNKVLTHPYFNKVLDVFNNSDVLIRACKDGNKNTIKWLLKMEVSPYVQDENGMSALMYAAKHSYNFVIKPFIFNSRCINLEDNKGENVLFYCIRNPEFIVEDYVTNNRFQNDLILNSDIDINHTNHNGESILIYCIKNNIIEPISKFLFHNTKIDVNIADNDGKTAAMYLTEKGLCPELLELHRKDCNYDYTNMNGESAMSILINKLYTETKNSLIPYGNYIRIMSTFVSYQCDFNFGIDNDENTPFMIMLSMNDITTATFCAKNLKKLDLSVKNKYGENITSLCYKLNQYSFLEFFKKNPTYDINYRDPLYQNTLLMFAAINNTTVMKELLENDPGIINEVNSKGENTLIIASKICNTSAVDILLKYGIDVNHQDNLGNTALHYAVEINSPFLIHRLLCKKADIHIKNNIGKSPLDYAQDLEINKNEIVDMMINPSIHLKKDKFINLVSSKYEEEIKNYLLPYINNDYPEYKSGHSNEIAKKDIYKRHGDNKNFRKTFKEGVIDLLKNMPYILLIIVLFIIKIII